MTRLTLLPLILLVAVSASAQTKKTDKLPSIACDSKNSSGCIVLGESTIKIPPPVTFTDGVGDDGVYRATFEDWGNKWRCYITSIHETDPRNVLYSDTDAVTITCIKPHDVKQGKP